LACAAGLAFAAGFAFAAAGFGGALTARVDPELLLDERAELDERVLDERVVLERDEDRVAAGTARDLEARASPSALGSRVIKDLLGWIARARKLPTPTFYLLIRTIPSRAEHSARTG
jgi:hypothetical protein